MVYDFDHEIDRLGTYSTQWDYAADRFGRSDVLPFSISDTDFAAPDEVLEAMSQRLRHPIFGYTRWNHDDYKTSIVQWFERDGAHIDVDWVVYSPSVMFSVASIIRMLSVPGEGVITLTPMYDAFSTTICANGRIIIPVRQASAMDGYALDWDTLETAVSRSENRLFLLTNPHNPTGKVYRRSELERLHEMCRIHDVTIITDDIHRDIVYEPARYVSMLDVSDEGVILTGSASKTFNVPGLIGSYCLIPDKTQRERFLFDLKQRNALSSASIFGMTAQMVAYRSCASYRDEMVAYLKENMALVKSFLNEWLPEVSFEIPQGTYLAWMDVSKLGIPADGLQDMLVNDGHVGIMPGTAYGDSTCLRMNVACPRSKLGRGLERMRTAICS